MHERLCALQEKLHPGSINRFRQAEAEAELRAANQARGKNSGPNTTDFAPDAQRSTSGDKRQDQASTQEEAARKFREEFSTLWGDDDSDDPFDLDGTYHAKPC